jgi:glycerate kinase
MRVLVAFDKFKDALAARAACEVARDALRARNPNLEIDVCPLTDGGESFAEILTNSLGGHFIERNVHGPRGEWLRPRVGFVPWSKISPAAKARLRLEPEPHVGSKIAVIDVASASGLELLSPEQRNPWLTSTLGTGELLRAAAEQGAAAILLGVGGSATNDLGIGALTALGMECATETGPLGWPAPVEWHRIQNLVTSRFAQLPPLRIACDVDNPLLGAHGATASFGPQKGLPRGEILRLEDQVRRMAAMLLDDFRKPVGLLEVPGAGAAGGISFGLMAATGAELVSGAALVSEWLDLPARIAAADLVITGEGRFDAGSLRGKGPGALARLASKTGKRVHLFVGQIDLVEKPPYTISEITPAGMPLMAALKNTGGLLAAAIHRSREI